LGGTSPGSRREKARDESVDYEKSGKLKELGSSPEVSTGAGKRHKVTTSKRKKKALRPAESRDGSTERNQLTGRI